METSLRALACSLCFVAACGGGAVCPPGTMQVGGVCLTADASVDAGAMDVGVDAGPCGVCAAPTLACDESTRTCVECVGDTTCGAEHCDPTTHTCVECTSDAHCADGVCDPTTHACLECTSDMQCIDAVCDTGTHTCVECTTDAHCMDAVCETVGHTCVECTSSDHCADAAAARCDATHACVACAADADCMHLAATPVCDATDGSCVGCLANSDCAATEGCDLVTHACRAFTPASVGYCGACVRDAECMSGSRCAATVFDDPSTPAADPVPVGAYCLFEAGGTCFPVESLTTVDGVMADLCARDTTTCPAIIDYIVTPRDCMTLDATGDAMCGIPGLHDGACRRRDATHNRCAVFCTSDAECPSGCDRTVTPPTCRL